MMINAISGSYSADYPLGDEESLSSSMMLILEERHNIYQTEIRSEYDSMQARNDLLKDMNSVLATLRTNRPNDEKTRKPYGTFTDSRGQSMDIFEWMQKNNIPGAPPISAPTKEEIHNAMISKHTFSEFAAEIDKVSSSQSDFDAAINNVKAAIDSANSEGQITTIHFQDLVDKSNRVAEMMSNLLSKDQKTSELIIANIR